MNININTQFKNDIDLEHEVVVGDVVHLITDQTGGLYTVSLQVKATNGYESIVDWGDGNTDTMIHNNTVEIYTHDYASVDKYHIVIYNNLDQITEVRFISDTNLTTSLYYFKNMPNLQVAHLYNCNHYGNLSFLEGLDSLTYFNGQSNNFQGDISVFTGKAMTLINVKSNTEITGSLSDLSSITTLTYISLDYTGVGGDIADLVPLTSLTTLQLRESSVNKYTSTTIPASWGNLAITLTSLPKFSTKSIDDLLIDMSAIVGGAVTGSINFTGLDEDRTTLSDAAVANLQANGYTLTGLPDKHTMVWINSDTKAQLNIETYVSNNNEVLHPSVLDLGALWNGYRYWLAATPYPDSQNIYENPSIWGSNDGTTWTDPGNNPVVSWESGYNADCDIFHEGANMYMIWKRYIASNNEKIRSLQSNDSTTWTNDTELFSFDDPGEGDTRVMCPSIIKVGATYYAYYIDMNAVAWRIRRRSSVAITGPYTGAVDMTGLTKHAGTDWWNIDVNYISGVYWMVLQASNAVQSSSAGPYIYFASSNNGVDWTRTDYPVVVKTEDWEYNNFYRASFCTIGTDYVLYYTARDQNNDWNIARVNMYFL